MFTVTGRAKALSALWKHWSKPTIKLNSSRDTRTPQLALTRGNRIKGCISKPMWFTDWPQNLKALSESVWSYFKKPRALFQVRYSTHRKAKTCHCSRHRHLFKSCGQSEQEQRMNCFLTLRIGWPRVRDRQPYGGVSSAHGWRVRVAITAEVAGLHTPKQSVLFLSSQKHRLVDSLATCYTKPKVFCWVRYREQCGRGIHHFSHKQLCL